MPLESLADAVLVLHVAMAAFVVGGLGLRLVGNLRHWDWVNAPGFRIPHAGAIALVIAETWVGLTCPLTNMEMWLREQAGNATYSGSFIAYWLQPLLYLRGAALGVRAPLHPVRHTGRRNLAAFSTPVEAPPSALGGLSSTHRLVSWLPNAVVREHPEAGCSRSWISRITFVMKWGFPFV